VCFSRRSPAAPGRYFAAATGFGVSMLPSALCHSSSEAWILRTIFGPHSFSGVSAWISRPHSPSSYARTTSRLPGAAWTTALAMSTGYAEAVSVMAATGQAGTQSPQPVQAAGSTYGALTPPASIRNLMAPGAEDSPQVRHTTRLRARHAAAITAMRGRDGSASDRLPVNRPVRNCLLLRPLVFLVRCRKTVLRPRRDERTRLD